MKDSNDSYGGIGIICEQTEYGFQILSVINHSPAYEANLVAGDFIWAVDDIEVINWDLKKLVEAIRGEIGTEVRLTIRRSGVELIVPLIREQIDYPE